MKVYRFDQFGSVDNLHIHNEEKPQPQRGELLIAVHAISLNFRDIAMVRGEYPQPSRSGLIPTSDAAGEVVAVGEGVEDIEVGDRVVSTFHSRWFAGRPPAKLGPQYGSDKDGWLMEFKVVSQESVVKAPDNLSNEEASTLPCAAVTAWSALSGSAPVRAGQTVLVQGTGGVSLFALQLAKSLGAKVIATTSSAKKADKLRELGADEVVNYTEDHQWGETVHSLADGKGVDRVVEVGGPATFDQSMRAVAYGGEIASIGFLSKENPGIDFFKLKLSGALVRQIAVGSRADLEDIVRIMALGRIKPQIDSVFDFDEAKEAFAHLDGGSHMGKIVIRI
jgi:NADPH:quinone reductase-like Zn-dependent oxidoreductase